MSNVHIVIVHKVKGIYYSIAIKRVYDALRASKIQGIEVYIIDQGWFEQHTDDGWNLEVLVKGTRSTIEKIIEKLANIEGYRISELFDELQGVTTGSNEFFVFDINKLVELEEKYKLSESELLYDCISGKDVKPWSITIRKKILFPYKINADKKTGEQSWIPVFMTEKGDVLDFVKVFVQDEKSDEDIHERLNKRIAYGIIPLKLIGVAKYLVDNYDKLKRRTYEQKSIEEYAGVWYGFHRPRSPNIIKTPNIVTPRIVKKPRFALNENKVIPLDSIIVLVPKENEDGKLNELRQELKNILGSSISLKDLLLYIVAILNSKISYIILKTRATRIRGGYYTIDEKYLSSIIVPKPRIEDKDILSKIFDCLRHSRWNEASELATSLYLKHAKLSKEDIELLLSANR